MGGSQTVWRVIVEELLAAANSEPLLLNLPQWRATLGRDGRVVSHSFGVVSQKIVLAPLVPLWHGVHCLLGKSRDLYVGSGEDMMRSWQPQRAPSHARRHRLSSGVQKKTETHQRVAKARNRPLAGTCALAPFRENS
jgi:hypothetical protein